jgi:hypothetical protein
MSNDDARTYNALEAQYTHQAHTRQQADQKQQTRAQLLQKSVEALQQKTNRARLEEERVKERIEAFEVQKREVMCEIRDIVKTRYAGVRSLFSDVCDLQARNAYATEGLRTDAVQEKMRANAEMIGHTREAAAATQVCMCAYMCK